MIRAAFTRAQRLAIAERDGWVCNTRYGHGCGQPVEKNSAWQADHIIPVWQDGPNTVENGQLLCWDCHRRKTDTKDTPDAAKVKRIKEKASGQRLSKTARRKAAIRANAPVPLAERQTTEVDG